MISIMGFAYGPFRERTPINKVKVLKIFDIANLGNYFFANIPSLRCVSQRQGRDFRADCGKFSIRADRRLFSRRSGPDAADQRSSAPQVRAAGAGSAVRGMLRRALRMLWRSTAQAVRK